MHSSSGGGGSFLCHFWALATLGPWFSGNLPRLSARTAVALKAFCDTDLSTNEKEMTRWTQQQ